MKTAANEEYMNLRDPEMLALIEPSALKAYLKFHGAKLRHRIPERCSVWDYRNEEIIVPERNTFDDYALSISEALDKLQRVEEREKRIIFDEIRQSDTKNKVRAIDLFCGCGGMTHGLEKAGIDVKLGIDNDSTCEYPYRANNHAEFLLESVENVNGAILGQYFGRDINVPTCLVGCPPCQPFSTYNRKEGDERRNLVSQFKRIVSEMLPDAVVTENVPGLAEYLFYCHKLNVVAYP